MLAPVQALGEDEQMGSNSLDIVRINVVVHSLSSFSIESAVVLRQPLFDRGEILGTTRTA